MAKKTKKEKTESQEAVQNIVQQQVEEWNENIGWLVQTAPTEPKAQYCLNIVMKYVELVDYTKALAEQYEISTKYLESAVEEIKRLKLEIVTIAARQSEKQPAASAPAPVKKGVKKRNI